MEFATRYTTSPPGRSARDNHRAMFMPVGPVQSITLPKKMDTLGSQASVDEELRRCLGDGRATCRPPDRATRNSSPRRGPAVAALGHRPLRATGAQPFCDDIARRVGRGSPRRASTTCGGGGALDVRDTSAFAAMAKASARRYPSECGGLRDMARVGLSTEDWDFSVEQNSSQMHRTIRDLYDGIAGARARIDP